MNVSTNDYLVVDDNRSIKTCTCGDGMSDGSDQMIDNLFEKSMQGDIDHDKIMMIATHAGKPKGVNTDHLSKVWQIDLDTKRCALDATTQPSMRK